MKQTIFIMVIAVAVLFGLPALGLFNLEFWGVKYEDARRNIYEETKSYKHGTIRDMQNLIMEFYSTDDDNQKQALKAVIRHRLASFDRQYLTPEIKDFLTKERVY